ncbi:RNA polymerase I-specific transcription initiation factor RRN3-like [Phalaenopsis equestris]|uniref:RNA polymerase I-specific transcription initiation factor RRN3-like n=1 Tax=Phalaenopsis equestris TaxID=78828 RepID=UPI0009E214E8|nr:RNA polymerase I-specific transcription initiation factor RRN3-like [Phalaenopsis equestris]
MGVEPVHSDMAMREVEDYYLSDSAVCSSIAEILEGVAKPPNLVAERDRDLYEQLLVIVIPSTRKENLDEEILFVTALKALSLVVYKISNVYHASLLRNIFSMCIWDYGLDARTALLELIANLAVVPDEFLEDSLEMLVRNFQPPERLHGYVYQPRWHEEKKRINGQLYETLYSITYLVPLAPLKLKDVLERRMPTFRANKAPLLSFVECMLGLESNEIGEYLQSTLLSMVVELLVDLDVNITWKDILTEDYNRGIFDMEVEDLEDNAENNSVGSQTVCRKGQGFGDLKQKLTDKLDCVMVIVCEHIKSSASDRRLEKVFETLMESFRKTVLNAYKSKFSQFIMFYACSLDPDISGLKFAIFLTDTFVSKDEYPNSRMSAVAYLASYLSRARFISSAVVSSIVKRLVEWCYDYCYLPAGSERIKNPQYHRIFYAGFQAVMYILCFRMRLLMDIPELKEILFHLPLEAILCHPLDPLRVCLPTIVQEFLRQAMAAHLLKKPFLSCIQNELLESEFSRGFGGVERLDMFFPFDPYLLKQSDRFMRPNFEFWSMVRKTYSNFNSDDDLDDLDPDSIDEGSDDGLDEEVADEDDEDEDEDEDEVELGCSMNNMSITPRPVFEMATASGSIPIPSRMPARIRPSVSPV